MSRIIATFFFVGYIKPFSGTWGSAAALPVAWLLYALGGWVLVALMVPVVFGLGWWATADMTRGKTDHDPSEIVIDEVAGQWLALVPVMIGASHAGADVLALWPGWVVAFVAFRFFDILKPGPIGWADRQHGPLGVMLDDIFAGIAAALTVGLAAYVSHGMLGA
ncbi:phosphatidylglycerophosphatase A [Rhodobacteraceae bacterium LMO-12]|nr:phosphatidylglycerophosphatase A [Rhodobacteraceae bacterium LMO-JJ12]